VLEHLVEHLKTNVTEFQIQFRFSYNVSKSTTTSLFQINQSQLLEKLYLCNLYKKERT